MFVELHLINILYKYYDNKLICSERCVGVYFYIQDFNSLNYYTVDLQKQLFYIKFIIHHDLIIILNYDGELNILNKDSFKLIKSTIACNVTNMIIHKDNIIIIKYNDSNIINQTDGLLQEIDFNGKVLNSLTGVNFDYNKIYHNKNHMLALTGKVICIRKSKELMIVNINSFKNGWFHPLRNEYYSISFNEEYLLLWGRHYILLIRIDTGKFIYFKCTFHTLGGFKLYKDKLIFEENEIIIDGKKTHVTTIKDIKTNTDINLSYCGYVNLMEDKLIIRMNYECKNVYVHDLE